MSLTKVTFSMIDGAYANVMDYGAVGDGLSDDTGAIDAAIADVVAAGGGVVWLPVGVYLVDGIAANTYNNNYVTLKGAGIDATVIKHSGAVNSHTIRVLGAEQFNIQDLTVDDANITSGTAGGIRVIGSYHCICERVKVVNGYHMSFEITGTLGVPGEITDASKRGFSNMFLECIAENQRRWDVTLSKAQFIVDGDAVASIIDNCQSLNTITITDSSGPDLIGIDQGYGARITNCHIRGMAYDSGSGQNKTAIHIEGTVNPTPWPVDGTNYSVQIADCFIENIANGISITQNSTTTIENVTFKDIWGDYSITNSSHQVLANNLVFDGCYRRAGVDAGNFNRDGGIFTSAGIFSNVRFINCNGTDRYNVNVVGGGGRTYENTQFKLSNAFLDGRAFVSGSPACDVQFSNVTWRQRDAAEFSIKIEGLIYNAVTDPPVTTSIMDSFLYNQAIDTGANHHVVRVDGCRFRSTGAPAWGVRIQGATLGSMVSNCQYSTTYGALTVNTTSTPTVGANNNAMAS